MIRCQPALVLGALLLAFSLESAPAAAQNAKVAAEKAAAEKAAADKLAADKAAADKLAAEKAAADKVAADKAAADKAAADKAEKAAAAVEAVQARAEGAIAKATAGKLGDANEDIRKNEKVIKRCNANEANCKAAKVSNDAAIAVVDKIAAATCGGGTHLPCFYVGAFVASASLVNFSVGNLHGGKTTHALISAAVPTLGLRVPIDINPTHFWGDVGMLSMVASKDLTAGEVRNGCKSNGDFEKHLPCEGNVSILPVFGGYLSLTAGTTDIGVVSVMFMAGGSTTSLDSSIRPFYGLAFGVVNLSKTFNFSRPLKTGS